MCRVLVRGVPAATMLLALCVASAAEKLSPVAVVATSTLEELAADYRYLSALPEAEELRTLEARSLAHFLGGRGLAGLEKSRPMGAAIWLRPNQEFLFRQEPRLLAFLPVADFAKLLESISLLGPRQGAGDVWQLDNSLIRPALFFTSRDGWVRIGLLPDDLDTGPENPLKLLEPLPEQYDLAGRIFAAELPDDWRTSLDTTLALWEKDVRRGPGEDDVAFARRRAAGTKRLLALREAWGHLDQATLGLTVDRDRRTVWGELTVTARADTPTAGRATAAVGKSETRFAGFVHPEACAVFHFSSTFGKDPLLQALAYLEVFPQAPQSADTLTNELAADLRRIIQEGKANAGLSLIGDGPFTLIMGLRLLRPKRVAELVEDALRQGVAQGHFKEIAVAEDPAEHQGVRFRTITVTLAGDDPRSAEVRFFGSNRVPVVVGTDQARQALYVAMGSDGLAELREAIDRSAASPPGTVPSMLASLRLGPLVNFAREAAPKDARLAQAGKILAGGEDRISISAQYVPHGYRVRLFELEQGALRALAAQIGLLEILHWGPRSAPGPPRSPPGPRRPSPPPPPPPDPEAHARSCLWSGQVFQSAGEPDKALKWYRKAIEANPGGKAAKEAKKRIEQLR